MSVRWCIELQGEVQDTELLQYKLQSVRSHLLRKEFQRFWEYTRPGWAVKFLDELVYTHQQTDCHNPSGRNTQAFWATTTGKVLPWGDELRHKEPPPMGFEHENGLWNQSVGENEKSSGLTVILRSSWLIWGELPLGAYPSGVQMGKTSQERTRVSHCGLESRPISIFSVTHESP
jgi:hypothetical protein